VILSTNSPHWTDRIGHYCPTSIVWRYFSIFDRRVRCLNWTALDLASSNANFWTGRLWESDERMITRSRQFCIRVPHHSFVDPFSSSTIKTIIVTLQGAAAVYKIASSNYAYELNLSNVFFPLAILGLLRLPAALWLSDDQAYVRIHDRDANDMIHQHQRVPAIRLTSKSHLLWT
jgi:hypothetical protein